MEAHKSGNIRDAELHYREVLNVEPRHPDANHNLGVLAIASGNLDAALHFFRSALEANPNEGQFWVDYIYALVEAKRLAEAVNTLIEGRRIGLKGEAVVSLQEKLAAFFVDSQSMKIQSLERNDAEGHNNLGIILSDLGRLCEAESCYRQAIIQNPGYADAHSNLGVTLGCLGRLSEAETSYREAIRLEPGYAEAHSNLGLVLNDLGRPGEAEAICREAIRLNPSLAEAYNNLGISLRNLGRPIEAEFNYRKAIRLRPNYAEAYNNLGNALGDLGRLREAESCYREAIRSNPDYIDAHSNLLFAANYDPDIDAPALKSIYANWGSSRRFPAKSHPNARDLDRRLRIGFVSPDFRTHSVGPFLWPLISEFPRSDFELFGYASMRGGGDAWTGRYREKFDQWRLVGMLDDDALAATICTDCIDVLVDLAGHTLGNRLGVFARKPAPVQATWLGYGGTTGLQAIDWYVGDPRLVPPGGESAFVERVWRLPETAFAYRAPEQMPEPSSPPGLTTGYPTFGCFSRSIRINARTLRVWGEILARVPNARLLLNASVFQEPEARALVAARFAECGGDTRRLDLVYTSPQSVTWAAYSRIDVALDPFPHNAGATTFEALWMGVPVVSKRDRIPLGRFGDSILSACGMADWVTDNEEAYVARAVTAVADLGRLSAVRSGLRARMRKSPLCDEVAFARQFAAALRGMWRDYCVNRTDVGSKDAEW